MASMDEHRSRELGTAVGSRDHDDLTDDQLEALETLLGTVEATLEEEPSVAARTLLAFWGGHVAADTDLSAPSIDPGDLASTFEAGFHADAVGVDLFQALSKTASAVQTEDPHPDLGGWTNRLAELTSGYVAHLQTHGENGSESA